MAQVYFHCSSPRRVLMDRCGADVGDLTEAGEAYVRRWGCVRVLFGRCSHGGLSGKPDITPHHRLRRM
jgi:hypothetical protein